MLWPFQTAIKRFPNSPAPQGENLGDERTPLPTGGGELCLGTCLKDVSDVSVWAT